MRYGIQDETQYHNRVNIGQIVGVRPADGIIQVRLTTGAVHKMPIPVYGFSPPIRDGDNQTLRSGTLSSWIRYMPQVGDYVKIGFGPDNRPEVLGAATWGDLPSERAPPGQLGGYAQITRARDRGEPGLETFYTLNPGEWDMRSSGNAYVRGTRFGTLTLAGGGEQLQLKKEQEESDWRTGLLNFDSTGATIRLGNVKRLLTGGFEETVVPGSAKEWALTVAQDTAVQTTLDFYSQRAGDLRDSLGVIEVGVAGPLRFQEQVFDGAIQAGQPIPYVREVDSLGNITEAQGSLATVHSITGSSIAEFSRTGYLTLTYGAATSITLDSARVALGSAAAAQPVVRGTDLNTYLTTTLSVSTPLGPSGPAIVGLVSGELSTVVFTD